MSKRVREKLEEYSRKRNFKLTNEPSPEVEIETQGQIFVIQKHSASNLHYDLRLEIDGVLKSWVLPKGPSLDPHIKRLAILTEDHPLSYAIFEGTIPNNEYGAGTVMVWNIGTYRNIQLNNNRPVSMRDAFKQGKIEVFLEGKKLNGNFALIQTNSNWLFLKKCTTIDEQKIF